MHIYVPSGLLHSTPCVGIHAIFCYNCMVLSRWQTPWGTSCWVHCGLAGHLLGVADSQHRLFPGSLTFQCWIYSLILELFASALWIFVRKSISGSQCLSLSKCITCLLPLRTCLILYVCVEVWSTPGMVHSMVDGLYCGCLVWLRVMEPDEITSWMGISVDQTSKIIASVSLVPSPLPSVPLCAAM